MQAGCGAAGFGADFWVFFLGMVFWAVDEACACKGCFSDEVACACTWLAMKLARRRAE